MSVSKKVRFEVFKRDGFQCCYCGKTPPEVILEIDHIDPKSKGGKDGINNLLTACFDCNRGKRDIPLDKAPPKLSENLEVLKWREEQLKEYRKYVKKLERQMDKDIDEIDNIFTSYFPDYSLSEKFKSVSIKNFLNKLPLHEVERAMNKACYKFTNQYQVNNSSRENSIKYFCGICWGKIKGDGRESKKY
jgi:CRISPR/Cas system Type II protein with McrA/HNH and RuvC-like nuclease domain